jgi:hypothetical protein
MSQALPPVAALVMLEFEDFDKWKALFDANQAARVKASVLAHHVQRGADNPNLASAYLPATDKDKLVALLSGEEVRSIMKQAGAKGTPSIKIMKPMGGAPLLDRATAGMIVVHKVDDYAKWRVVYDEFDAKRKELGITGHAVNQLVDDPNLVIVYHQAESVEALKKFAQSDELKSAMQNAGVAGPPEITFWNAQPAVAY